MFLHSKNILLNSKNFVNECNALYKEMIPMHKLILLIHWGLSNIVVKNQDK